MARKPAILHKLTPYWSFTFLTAKGKREKRKRRKRNLLDFPRSTVDVPGQAKPLFTSTPISDSSQKWEEYKRTNIVLLSLNPSSSNLQLKDCVSQRWYILYWEPLMDFFLLILFSHLWTLLCFLFPQFAGGKECLSWTTWTLSPHHKE